LAIFWNCLARVRKSVAERANDGHLVREVQVDRGRRVLDRLGDLAHGDALVTLGDEELASGVEDLSPELVLLPAAAILGSHNVGLLRNGVKLRHDVIACQAPPAKVGRDAVSGLRGGAYNRFRREGGRS